MLIYQNQKSMKTIIHFCLVLSIVAFANTSCAQKVISDKNIEIRSVQPFNGIKISGGIDVYISQDKEYALGVSASEKKYRDNIITTVKDGILNIYYDDNSFSFNERKNLRVYVSFKTLESLEASGASDVSINNVLNSENLKLVLSGASDISGKINIQNMVIDMSGASIAKIDGKIKNLKITASGASDLKNYNLVVDNCISKLSGASDLKLTVNSSLTVKASGASSFRYKGNPTVKEISESGASNVSKSN